ncbi:MAG: hypothetical protein U0736_22040 [Gemmataceae bacterium]
MFVADGDGWRPLPSDASTLERQPEQRTDPVLLFALPGHLCASLWRLVEQGDGDFDAFATEVGQFLTFKQLSPATGAAVELVRHGAGGTIDPRGLWAVINMGDDTALVELPGLRVRLPAGEGCQVPPTMAADVLPPAGELPILLLLVRHAAAEAEA